MPPETPRAMSATWSTPNYQVPTPKKTLPAQRLWELEIGNWKLVTVLDLFNLPSQHFTLRDGDLFAAGLARLGPGQQLTRALAGDHHELEAVFLGWSFHDCPSYDCELITAN